MKKIYLAITFIASAIMFIGCQKDFDGILTAEIENYNGGDNKVYINNQNYSCWHNGDVVKINGADVTLSISGDVATLITELPDQSNITAIYPAEYATDGSKKFTLPQIQEFRMEEAPNGTKMQVIKAPMVAYAEQVTTGSKLTFKNICSIVKVIVNNPRNTDITMKRIELMGSTQLCGEVTYQQTPNERPSNFNLNTRTGRSNIYLTFPQSGSDTVQIAANTSRSFYIAVPPVTTKLEPKVEYFTQDEHYITISTVEKPQAHEIAPNTIGTMTLKNSSLRTYPGWEGLGTADNPYKINTYEDFKTIISICGTHSHRAKIIDHNPYFIQTANITRDNLEQGPYAFSGYYNGDNHTMTINYGQATKGAGGVFNSLNGGAKVSNLNVDINVTRIFNSKTQSWPTGGIADHGAGTIENCTVTGTIIGNEYVGGIVGQTGGCTIQNCTNHAALTARKSNAETNDGYVGGIIGYNNGTSNIKFCTTDGTLTGVKENDYVGLTGSGKTTNITYTPTE